MEAEGTHHLYARSLEKHGIRYNPFVGDGDCKSYTKICKLQPYGPTVYIPKEDCIAHVSKRMGTALRKLQITYKGKFMCVIQCLVSRVSLCRGAVKKKNSKISS